jgi:two-component system, NarL family, nitrate/nitrite response regulator NarL
MKIVVIEDDLLTRDGMLLSLRALVDGVEILEAANLTEAFDFVAAHADIQLILLDLNLAESHGITTLISLKQRLDSLGLDTRVVVVSGEYSEELVHDVLNHHGTGFILKATTREVLTHALTVTLSGGISVPDPALYQGLPRPATPLAKLAAEGQAIVARLTDREYEVATHLVKGLTNKRIAILLMEADGKPVSEHTVRVHIGKIAWKFGVKENAKSGLLAAIARLGLKFPPRT